MTSNDAGARFTPRSLVRKASHLHARAAFGFHELLVDVLQMPAHRPALALADASAPYTSVRLKSFSNTGIEWSRHSRTTLPRVMPPRQYFPVDVHTSPLRTMKKWVELQVATKPCGSSISASS